MPSLQIGDLAPDFSLPAASGKEVVLSSFRGKKVILYFYPKDNTPGCTTQACDFRDHIEVFEKAGVVILGVSKDSLKSHGNFIAKYELPFELLSDEELKVQEAYGVWVLKKNYGKEYMGTERSTFVIDEQGKLLQIHRKVSVKGHIEKLIESLG
ncbi:MULTISPECIES: thioredoxin-dependent thiol peroxidase [unclassified Fusibacter]|uniref:thioredoxin-dependent thiol peroxidase n=1 Tax=unclassified Fusibacter TaxID=2624464 RepID=UPI00101252D7|nr:MULTISPECIES: thioredoxin-dependent thiol peroxidase [unclassified Fusibacter]MCK8061430.1 thioredoxin-dependent thiol peroxidase [Fusibacter sp. A2]NPE23617.1 thioredoxin-dependent thiol peroxidase [Fusibacter sp. A1]RXV58890.1 thioredoxin-dependent thiol peroxidase [Fusibacter sp. A1]